MGADPANEHAMSNIVYDDDESKAVSPSRPASCQSQDIFVDSSLHFAKSRHNYN